MGDLLKDTKNATAIFDGNLVVGNHDTITLLGAQSQVKLRDYSKTVSKLLLRENDELDDAIVNVVSEIEIFENHAKKKPHQLFGLHNRHKEITREYSIIVAYIERVCLFLQLQQAQLLKEVKLLEKLSITVRGGTTALEKCIKVSKEVLSNRPVSDEAGNKRHQQNFICSYEEDDDTWYSRLERRIDDLCISHTVSLQNQAQIKILYDNNLVLLDRISSAISNTFPIWQSQMVMVLGIERLEQRMNDQNQVLGNMQNHSLRKILHSDYSLKNQPLDVDGIRALNIKLTNALRETASVEKQDLVIRKNIQEAIHDLERG